jgi:hypothetical protein
LPEEKPEFTLLLQDGTRLTVRHVAVLPQSRSRLQDYLNTDHRFLQFRLGNKKIFVNRKTIVKIIP